MWEYRAVGIPATLDAVGVALDRMGAQGWEYVDHFDGQVPVPEAPPDLRGQDIAGRQDVNGHALLARGRAATKQVAGHYLIFKRPLWATEEMSVGPGWKKRGVDAETEQGTENA